MRRRAILAAGLWSLVAAGCHTPAVSWLSDSSGYVFTEKDGARLVLCALGEGRRMPANKSAIADFPDRRVLVENLESDCVPAVSPDGKRIAVCRQIASKRLRKFAFRIVVYDLSGKVVQTTKEFLSDHLPDENKDGTRPPIPLAWGPKTECVLMPQGIVNLEKDEFIELPSECVPQRAALLKNSCHPEGQGFVTMTFRLVSADRGRSPKPVKSWNELFGELFKDLKAEFKPAFYDWQGKELRKLEVEQNKDLPPALIGETNELLKEVFKKEPNLASLVHWSKWEGDQLVICGPKVKLILDVEKGAVQTRAAENLKFVVNDGVLESVQPFSDQKSFLCVVRTDQQEKGGPARRRRIEVQCPAESTRRIVVADGDLEKFEPIASPDGNLAAVRTKEEGILVINSSGRILSKTTVSD